MSRCGLEGNFVGYSHEKGKRFYWEKKIVHMVRIGEDTWYLVVRFLLSTVASERP
jgi:hypothetical protein